MQSEVRYWHNADVEPEVRDPEPRLRLTVGLRKEADRWIIAHEHHSFPLDS